jgi:predicted nuclease with TOPRIM domain|tara:strand:+ start:485 stop:781 length:297 start_codon:yes stop_codon:yes gene_type:complete
MSENLTTIIITLVSVLFGAGGWKFYEFLIKNKREKQKEDLSENNIFRDDLISRVDKLEADKGNCLNSLLEISKEVSSLTTKVEFLERENISLKTKLEK